MNTDTLQRKVLVSLTVTITFLVATILLVSVPASRFTSPPAREYAAGVARAILAFLVIVLVWRWNRIAHALRSPSPRSWAIVLPVALYSLIVYPLLFTGTLRLNLNQPNLAAGVAFNGFAAGALEELVFRGLILSLLLTAMSDNHKPRNAWYAILISAFLFSLPHALNIFVGHAEARVLAQLVWSFLLGVVFRIERIRSRESARDRNSAVTVTCCCTGFRPSALVHLRSDITAQDSNLSERKRSGSCVNVELRFTFQRTPNI